MKIIRDGDLEAKSRWRGTCIRCDCRIECDQDEVYWATLKISFAGTRDCPYMNCPTPHCFRVIELQRVQ